MVVNKDHYINRILHDAGEHELTVEQFGTPYVCIAARILVDPGDPDDVAAVNALQDQLAIDAGRRSRSRCPDYDTASLDATRKRSARPRPQGLTAFDRTFGRQEDVDPVRHLIGDGSGLGRPARRRRPPTSASTPSCRSASTS